MPEAGRWSEPVSPYYRGEGKQVHVFLKSRAERVNLLAELTFGRARYVVCLYRFSIHGRCREPCNRHNYRVPSLRSGFRKSTISTSSTYSFPIFSECGST